MIPATAPTKNVIKTGMLNSLTAVMINSYFPNNNRIKAPDIPGRIMAQMAIAPERMINHHVSGVLVGVSTVIV